MNLEFNIQIINVKPHLKMNYKLESLSITQLGVEKEMKNPSNACNGINAIQMSILLIMEFKMLAPWISLNQPIIHLTVGFRLRLKHKKAGPKEPNSQNKTQQQRKKVPSPRIMLDTESLS